MVCTSMSEEDGLSADEGLLFVWDGCGYEVAFGLRICAAEHDGLVDCEPSRDAIVVALKYYTGVFDEVWHDVFGKPTAVGILEIQREIPVVECDDRFDAIFKASIDDIVVMCKSLFIDLTASKREDSRPGDGEGICWYTKCGNSGNI